MGIIVASHLAVNTASRIHIGTCAVGLCMSGNCSSAMPMAAEKKDKPIQLIN
jgi:hypothetical protein